MNLFTRSETSRRRVSYNQLEKLWEFVTSNREIALGFNRCSEARELARRMWETVASTLNSKHFDGAVKDAKSWCKYWNEYKSKLKKLAANLRTSNQESGGDPFAFRSLSDIENKFIQFLGEDFGYGVARVETFEESQTEIRTPPSSEPSMWDEPGPSWRTMPSNLPENLITYETPHFHTPLPPYHTPPSDDTAPESPHTTSTPVLSALLNPCTASPVHLQSPHPHTAPPRLHTEKPRPPRSKPPLYIAAAPPHTSHSTNQTQSSPPHTQSPRPHTQSPPHTQPPHPHTQPPRPLTSPASSQASSPRAPRRGRRRQRPLSAEEARTALVRISKRRAGVEEQNSLLLRQLVNDIRDIKQMLQRVIKPPTSGG